MEYIGGGVVFAGGATTGCKNVLALTVSFDSFEEGPASRDPGDSGEGMLSFMVVADGTLESGMKDDADECSERELLVRATVDSSEPADDTVGDDLL
jgi:hypothetical protein